MLWFGEPWDSPINQVGERVDLPASYVCDGCEKMLLAHHQGVGILAPEEMGEAQRMLYYRYDGQTYFLFHLECFRQLYGPPQAEGIEIEL